MAHAQHNYGANALRKCQANIMSTEDDARFAIEMVDKSTDKSTEGAVVAAPINPTRPGRREGDAVQQPGRGQREFFAQMHASLGGCRDLVCPPLPSTPLAFHSFEICYSSGALHRSSPLFSSTSTPCVSPPSHQPRPYFPLVRNLRLVICYSSGVLHRSFPLFSSTPCVSPPSPQPPALLSTRSGRVV